MVRVVSSALPLLIVGSCCILLLGVGLAFYVDQLLNIPGDRLADVRIMLLIMIATVALTAPAAPFCLGLTVRQKYVVGNVIRLSVQIIRSVLLFILLVALGPRVVWVVVANSVASIAETVALAVSYS